MKMGMLPFWWCGGYKCSHFGGEVAINVPILVVRWL